jgi:hypothetical protein
MESRSGRLLGLLRFLERVLGQDCRHTQRLSARPLSPGGGFGLDVLHQGRDLRELGGTSELKDGEFVGRLKTDGAELLVVAHALSNVVRSPVDLAVLFEMAGSEAQEMAGEILGQDAFGTEDHTQNL